MTRKARRRKHEARLLRDKKRKVRRRKWIRAAKLRELQRLSTGRTLFPYPMFRRK